MLIFTCSHCADAVVSLANRTTIVGDVAATLVDFLVAWVTTPSSYDVLFAKTIRDDWARRHRPVLTTRQDGHVLYTGFSPAEPNGEVVRCHRQCAPENQWSNVRKKNILFICKQCNSQCVVGKATYDASTFLGARHLIKTVFPQKQAETQWGPVTRPTTPMIGPTSTSGDDHSSGLTKIWAAPARASNTGTHLVPPMKIHRVTSQPDLPSRMPHPHPIITSQSVVPPPLPIAVRAPAPAIIRAQSAPQVQRKRQEYPAVEFSTSKKRRKM